MRTTLRIVILLAIFFNQSQAQKCQTPLDVAILVDASGSICDHDPTKLPTPNGHATCSNWQNVLNFTNAFVNDLNVGPGPQDARVAVIRFGNSATVLWQLNTFTTKSAVQNAVDTLIFYPGLGQYTNTPDALDLARTQVLTAANGARDNILDVVIVITDGKSTIFPEKTLPNAQLLKGQGVTIVCVGVTSLIDKEELCAMASVGPQYCITEPTFTTLVDSLNNLLVSSCVSSVIEFDTAAALTSLVILTGLVTRTPTNAIGKLPNSPLLTSSQVDTVSAAPQMCTQLLDVAILIDASGSICDNNSTKVLIGTKQATCNNWQTILDFVSSFVKSFPNIGPLATQVAVIRFGNSAQVLWQLNTYQTQAALLAAIQTEIVYPALGQNTNTQLALTLAHTVVFTAAGGDRPGMRNLVLIITDGKATVDAQNTIPAARKLKDDNVTVLAVGVTTDVDNAELCAIASPPLPPGLPNAPQQQNCFKQPTFDKLKEVLTSLVMKVCLNDSPS